MKFKQTLATGLLLTLVLIIFGCQSQNSSNKPLEEKQILELSNNLLKNNSEVEKIGIESIKLSDYEHAPINDKYYLTYHQYYKGLMAYNSEVYFVISGRGDVVNSIFKLYPNINVSTEAKISEVEAIDIAQKHLIDQNTSMFVQFKEKLGFEEVTRRARPESATLIILPMEKGEEFTYNLAWQTEFNVPLPKRVFVNAVNGEILKEEETYIS